MISSSSVMSRQIEEDFIAANAWASSTRLIEACLLDEED